MKTRALFLNIVAGLVVTLFLLPHESKAQYNTGLGLRVGGTTGIDGKFFTRQSHAIEGIVGWFGNGSSLTVLIERYQPVYNASGLYVYYGGGPHVAFYNGDGTRYSYFGRELTYHRNNDVALGIDGIIGFEYRLPDGIPISFSLDLKPFIEIGSGGYLGFAPDPSFGVKFIFR